MVSYTWHKGVMPEGLPVRQVYGIAFSKDGRIFLRIDNGRYKLTGGRPEGAESFEETLQREYLEEANIELENIHYLGYLTVEDGQSRYAQVRMIAKIRLIHENRIDPDTGRMYGRVFVEAGDVKEYLAYSDEAGNRMMDDAVRMAQEVF